MSGSFNTKLHVKTQEEAKAAKGDGPAVVRVNQAGSMRPMFGAEPKIKRVQARQRNGAHYGAWAKRPFIALLGSEIVFNELAYKHIGSPDKVVPWVSEDGLWWGIAPAQEDESAFKVGRYKAGNGLYKISADSFYKLTELKPPKGKTCIYLATVQWPGLVSVSAETYPSIN